MSSDRLLGRPPKLFVCRPFPGPGLKILESSTELTINNRDRVLNHNQLRHSVKGVDAIVSLLTDEIDAAVMDAAGPNLKLIANYAIGFDNIDIKAAVERKIVVTNTPGDIANAIAEHTIALTLALGRQLLEADRYVRSGKYQRWEPDLFLGLELEGKELGIVGMGRIGHALVRIAKGFGMKVSYYDVLRQPKIEASLGIAYRDLDHLLTEADVISLNVPLTPKTHHLIGERELSKMKPTAILINTSRGPVVDENALAHALTKRYIAGAGLDVYEHEPKITRQLQKLSNTILTPHIASATTEARNMMSQMVADNVNQFFTTGVAVNPVPETAPQPRPNKKPTKSQRR